MVIYTYSTRKQKDGNFLAKVQRYENCTAGSLRVSQNISITTHPTRARATGFAKRLVRALRAAHRKQIEEERS